MSPFDRHSSRFNEIDTMKCKRAKQAMALCVGRDLDPATEQELRRHLSHCPRCHKQWNRLSAATSILHQSGQEEAEVASPQFWPSISGNIQAMARQQTKPARSFSLSNALVPMVAVASLMLAVVSIRSSLIDPPSTSGTPITRGLGSSEAPAVTVFWEFPQPEVAPPSSPMRQYYRERDRSRYHRDGDQYPLTPAAGNLLFDPDPAYGDQPGR